MTMHYPKTDKEWLELRHQYVSSTESAALFGLSPYSTAFELAVQKKQKFEELKEFPKNERMSWGLRLQDAIAKGISEDYGVKVRRVRGYSVNPNCNMGASFDYEIVGISSPWEELPQRKDTPDLILRDMYRDLGPGILEIKNVDYYVFKREWKTEDGQLEAPAHIEIQVQHQLHCIERKWGVMGVLVGGNDNQLVIREYDAEVGQSIEMKIADFWALIGRGEMPPVKLPEDIAIIRQLYMSSTPGKLYDGREDAELEALCKVYKEQSDLQKLYDEAHKTSGAKILMKLGDHEKAILNGYSITANSVAECEMSYKRGAYRNLRVTEKKVKTND